MLTETGTKTKDLELFNEELTEYWEMGGVVWEEELNASSGLNKPCGIDLNDNRLFVSEYETGDFICIDLDSM